MKSWGVTADREGIADAPDTCEHQLLYDFLRCTRARNGKNFLFVTEHQPPLFSLSTAALQIAHRLTCLSVSASEKVRG